ncbi:hypothetical protein PR390_27015, partial [Mycobacterium marinum]|nr:hypothetical protein [Mycobacterium marinum]MDC9008290.1 hypothetical protein [Mycobacterium marinum]
TGAFVSGDMNNGFFWRGTGQGLIGADYTITIPHIPITVGGGGILKLPLTGEISNLKVEPFGLRGEGGGGIPLIAHFTLLGDTKATTIDIPGTSLSFELPSLPVAIKVDINDELSVISTPEITINPITFNEFVIGSDETPFDVSIDGGIEPLTVTVFHLSPTPGFGNSGGAPSSGFFNSGDGVSGF